MMKEHIQHCVLYEFRKGNNATVVSNDMNSVYLSVQKYQRWSTKFWNGDFHLEDGERSGRPPLLENDELRAVVEKDPSLAIGKIAEMLGVSWSTVQEDHREIGTLDIHVDKALLCVWWNFQGVIHFEVLKLLEYCYC